MTVNDREKIIKGIQECDLNGGLIGNCPYKGILMLLKEQEAVRPERQHSGGGTTWWNVCGNCRTAINPNDKFCHECGKAVKWE